MKHKVLFYSSFIIIFLLLQTTLLKYIAISGIVPNLLIVFIIVAAMMRGNIEGGIAGFCAGLAQDLLFGSVIGFYALLGLYLGIAAGSINRRLFRENLLVVVFFTFVYSVVYEALVHILNTVMSGSIQLIHALTSVILPEAVYNCVVSVLIYWLLLRAGGWLTETDNMVRKY